MSTPVITENSMYKDAAGRAAIVADPRLATELFFINFLGFVGLYALNDSRGYMKTHEASEKKLKINEIADDNHDSSLAVKLCVDAGVLPEAKAYSITRFLNLVKTRVVRAKDVDDAKIRDLIAATQLDAKPMSGAVKAVVGDFMSAKISVKEFSRLIYDVSKKTEWRDYSMEFRTIVLKGQYTDYFTVMKRAAAGAPAATSSAPAALPPAYVPPVTATAPVAAAKPVAVAPPPKPAFDAVKVWVDAGGKFDEMMKSINLQMVAGLKATEVLDGFAGIDPDAVKNWPLKDVTTRGDGGSVQKRVRLAAYQKSLAACLLRKDWTGMTILDVGYMPDGGDLLELFVASAAKLDAAWVANNNTGWRTLARLISVAGGGSVYDIATTVKAVVAVDVPNHNAFLYSIWRQEDNVVAVDKPSREAVAWVKANGLSAGPYHFSFLVVPTKAGWEGLSKQDRLAWVLENWNATAVVKLNDIMGIYGAMTFNTLSWSQVVDVCGRVGVPKWQDQSFWSQLTSMSSGLGGVKSYSTVAAICALVELRKNGRLESSYIVSRVSDVFESSWQELAVFEDGFADICANIKLDAPSEVFPYSTAMLSMFPNRNLRWTKGVDLKSSEINKSSVFLLPFIYKPGMAAIGTISEANKELHIPGDSSPEVVAWVKAHGLVFSPRLVNVAVRAKGQTPASIYMKGIMASMPDDQRGGAITADEVAQLKAMTADQWAAVAREVGDVLVKTDARFMEDSDMSRRSIFMAPYNSESFADAITAAKGYLVNYHPKIVTERGRWDASVVKRALRAPMTQDKLNLLVSITGKHDSHRRNHDGVNALALLESILKDVPDLSKCQYVLSDIVPAAAAFDLDATIAALKGVATTDNQTLRLPMLYMFSASGGIRVNEILGPDLYVTVRWAWGVSGDDLVKMINAGSSYTGGYNATYYTELEGVGRLAIKYWPEVRALMGGAVYDESVNYSPYLPVYAWGAKVLAAIDVNRFSAGGGGAHEMSKVIAELDANDPDDAAMMAVYATRIIPYMADGMGTTSIPQIIALTKSMVLAGGDSKMLAAKMNACIKYTITAPRNTVVDIAQAVTSVTASNLGGLIDRDAMISLVDKLSKSTSKAALAAVPLLAFGDDKSTVLSPLFVEAVRAARCERAVINRVVKGNAVQQALAVVNSDPNGVKLVISGERLNTFLKFNDIDVTALTTTTVTKLEDLDKAKGAVAAVVPPLAMTDISTPEVNKDRTKYLHKNNQYNHGKQLGMEVKKTFAVDIKGQRERYDAWVKAHPDTRVMTLFHGTGTINAAFILRFGFKIIKSSDPSVTGRMLGDGIYFADNINKSMLYMSNAGYVREAGQEGYVMKCKVALGKRPKDNREGSKEHGSLISNEWSIFNIDQIVIEEAYYGYSRWKQDVRGILGENAYRPMESCFMFMDGRVPVTMTDTADFETIASMGDHITIERTAKGPIINIRHDASVKPMDRCYRYGEEMQATDNAKELRIFLKLLSNTY